MAIATTVVLGQVNLQTAEARQEGISERLVVLAAVGSEDMEVREVEGIGQVLIEEPAKVLPGIEEIGGAGGWVQGFEADRTGEEGLEHMEMVDQSFP